MASPTDRGSSDEALRPVKIRAAAPRRWSPAEGEGARPPLAEMAERIERRAKPDLSADDVIAEIDRFGAADPYRQATPGRSMNPGSAGEEPGTRGWPPATRGRRGRGRPPGAGKPSSRASWPAPLSGPACKGAARAPWPAVPQPT